MIKTTIPYILLSFFIINPCIAIERHNSEFRELIKKNIFKSVKASGEKIGISAVYKKASNEVVVYINGHDSRETVTCQIVEDLYLVKRSITNSGKRHGGNLKVGLCPNKDAIGENTINNIENKISNVKIFNKLDEIKKKEFGLYVTKEHINSDITKIYYPSIIIGHGVGIIRSYMFFPADNKHSLVIQYSPEDSSDVNSPLFITLNKNINGIASGIIQRLMERNYE